MTPQETQLGDIGEAGLLRHLRSRIPAAPDVPVGAGDDAAVVSLQPSALVTTDALVDRRTRSIAQMTEFFIPEIRSRGMVPGLSTHMPETPVYADEMDLDVGTYIQIYNAAGFLMQIEIDWVHRMIWNAKKPIITIKPLAAGRLHPLVGLAFCWATLRDCDMVAIGTMSADEAREVIDISLSQFERRASSVELQTTRSSSDMLSQSASSAGFAPHPDMTMTPEHLGPPSPKASERRLLKSSSSDGLTL